MHYERTLFFKKMGSRWRGLSVAAQQRNMVFAGAVLLMLLSLGALYPGFSFYIESKESFSVSQKTMVWVEEVEPILLQSNRSLISRSDDSTRVDGASLLATVTSFSREYGVDIERAEPKNSGLAIWVTDVPFEILLQMLHALNSNRGVDVTEAQLSSSQSTSLCSGRLLLR